MLSPLVSLVLLFGQHGKAVTVAPPVSPDNPGNRHVAPAENPQPHPFEQADADGREVPFDAKLFAKPEGVKIEENKP